MAEVTRGAAKSGMIPKDYRLKLEAEGYGVRVVACYDGQTVLPQFSETALALWVSKGSIEVHASGEVVELAVGDLLQVPSGSNVWFVGGDVGTNVFVGEKPTAA